MKKAYTEHMRAIEEKARKGLASFRESADGTQIYTIVRTFVGGFPCIKETTWRYDDGMSAMVSTGRVEHAPHLRSYRNADEKLNQMVAQQA